MTDRHGDSLSGDFEAVEQWFLREEIEIAPLELDRIKRRAMAQAGRQPSVTTHPGWIAGGISATKGLLMGKRPRPLVTLFLVIGLLAVFSVPALFATSQLPTIGNFDAAQSQYEDDDDDGTGNKNEDDDDDGGDDDDDAGAGAPLPPAAGGATGGVGTGPGNNCTVFRRQNFNTPGKLDACGTATQQVLSGAATADAACAGFSKAKRRGQKRSDYAACVASIVLTQGALQKASP